MSELTGISEFPQEQMDIVHISSKIEPAKANPVDFANKTICLSLKLSSIGMRKQVASNAVQSDAEESMLHVSKDLLESKTFKDIKSKDGEIKKYIKSIWVPSPMFRNGIYLIPVSILEDVDNRLEEFKLERNELVQKFILEYPSLKEEAEKKLNSLFNPLDYPDIGKIQRAFSMDTRYVTFSTPGKLKEISQAIWAREMEKAEAELKQAAEEIKAALRENMADLVDHMISRLSPEDEGSTKKKKFHASAIVNFNQFLDTFKDRNIVGDEDLAKLVSDARGLLNGVEAKDIRTNTELKAQLQTKFEGVKATLDTMLVDRPRRKFKLKDEASEAEAE